ncbi:hypothetical protein Syun_028171 [Stephania yunnanensis]|uniref:SURF1-like protein n=1 Tax=Stephania yunnanensis TaxID=152371 RepID=A0AAP0EJD7_9MAGN
MSSSSWRLASSISKALNPRKCNFSIPSHRSPKPTKSSLTTLAESPSTSSVSYQSQGEQTRRWSRWLLFIPGAITFGLGTWQIFRRLDKIELLEYRRNRLELKPLNWRSLSSSFGGDLNSLEFRRLACEGVFDDDMSIFVGPRSRSISGVTENGYYVITPLMPIEDDPESVQSPILVNRGWVPRSWHDKALRQQASNVKSPTSVQEKEEGSWWKFWVKKPRSLKRRDSDISAVKVIGVVRRGEKPSIFVPSNDPSTCQWFYVDVPMIARACGLPDDTVYIEDINDNANASKPYPVPRMHSDFGRYHSLKQEHIKVSLTWCFIITLSSVLRFVTCSRFKTGVSREQV